MSRVAVAGAGYVGLTTAACLADLGNEVVAVDIDQDRIKMLRRHRLPIYEPGLREVVERNARAGRLSFTTCYEEAVPGADYAFIAVATPEGAEGAADLSYVEAAARSVAENMNGPLVVVNKSTVPIGTGDFVSRVLAKHAGEHRFDVVSNPEFLREGSALADFMQPDRVVIGAHRREAADLVAKLYEPLNAPILLTTMYTAEMIKYASNSFLATRISFINEMARICERVDADVKVVSEGMGLDRRIGSLFLEAGIGYGGSCFPKDVKALAATAKEYGYHPELLRAVMDINQDQQRLVIEKLKDCLGSLRGQVVGLLGLAFKPNTDDLREAPSLEIARGLLAKGATVRAYDPAAMVRAKRLLPDVNYRRDAYQVARGADAIAVITEWNEFKLLDLPRVRRSMRRPVVVDGRNIYDPVQMRDLGFVYRGIGRN
ncbi:MAG: UDP-glucose/GDP-mannose dehydrogenase family protein [Chloroflexi bacterium]|nr:MAG: UDP-glucose/GDP-mannose dehydrogenase family protein [Chloroflexota bacterium]TME19784.1 MAG: UDP-glucose/GDP-mannose dehydrogenase family protein [Chloroflexota bacterium]